MNEQDNTAIIKTLYEAFARGHVQTILNHLAPGVEWVTEGPAAVPYARTYVGPGEVAEFFQLLATTQENHKLITDDYIAQGDKVATSGRYMASVKATGKRFDTAVAHIFTIQDGKVTRFLDLFDTAAVAEAYRS